MEKKALKRDIAWSKANLLKDTENHRLNSDKGRNMVRKSYEDR